MSADGNNFNRPDDSNESIDSDSNEPDYERGGEFPGKMCVCWVLFCELRHILWVVYRGFANDDVNSILAE